MSTVDDLLKQIPWFEFTICLSTAILLLEIWLDTRQIKSFQRMMDNQQSLQFIKYNPEAFKQNSKWNIARLEFSRIENLIGFSLELITLYFGLLRVVYDGVSYFWVDIVGLNQFQYIIVGVTFIFVVSGICTFVKTFFELYRLVFVDSYSSFKENSTSESSKSSIPRSSSLAQLQLFLSAWSLDQLKSFMASVVFGIPILCVIIVFLSWEVRYQWLLTSFFVSILSLLFTDFYADILAPFYEHITELNQDIPKEKELKKVIEDLSAGLQFPLSEVNKVDTSKQFAHSNAYLLGYGRKKRIVLYDNLITQLTTTEILAIIGHEIGHHKHYHTWKKLFVQMVFIGNFIFVFSHVIQLQAFYTSFGFERPDVSVGLVLFAYMYSSFASLMRFVTNTVSRSFEFKADTYAIDHGLAMERALIKLHVMHNIANIMPDHIYSIYHYSHPSLLERLEAMQQYRKKNS